MKVFITDLEAYNAGNLVGQWHTLPMNEDLLAEAIENILRDGKNICEDTHHHEEYFITDYECEYISIDEYANIAKLNEIAQMMEELNEDEIKAVSFLMDHYLVTDIYEAIEKYEDVRIHENSSMEDIAYDYIQDCYNLDDMPSIISNNIDYESIAKDMEIEGSFYKVDSDIYEYIG